MPNVGFTSWTTPARTPDRKAPMSTDKPCPSAVFDRAVEPATGLLLDRTGHRARRFVRAVGMATTTATGALTTAAVIAPQAATTGPVLSTPVNVMSSSMQSAINEILEAQQQVITIVSDKPYATPYDIQNQVVPYTKMLTDGILLQDLNAVNASQGFDSNGELAPPVWSAPATNPLPMQNLANADNEYITPHTGDGTWTATIIPGPGTQDFSFSTMSGDGVTGNAITVNSIDLSAFKPNANGTYTITFSPTEHSGNWVDTQQSVATYIRDTVGNWGLLHDSITYHEDGVPAYTMPVLSNDGITSILNTVGTNLVSQNSTPLYIGFADALAKIPFNILIPVGASKPTVIGPALIGQDASAGRWQLDPNQALILKVPDVPSHYSSVDIAPAFTNVGAQPAWATSTGQLNDTQVFNDPDGFTYYVISAKDPGVANWLDTDGASNGDIALRWQGAQVPVSSIPRPTSEVVPVADVKNYLPADTPTVTPAERVVDFQDRLLEYDYKVDQDHNSGWVTENLEAEQIKAAIGTNEFDKLFGSQSNVPSVLDRMTDPSLMADPTTVIHDMLSNKPSESLSAIVQNIPVLLQDIEMPAVLAALRLDELLKQGTGLQALGTWWDQTFTDPTTSITSGLLNARDDLDVSIMNADSYSPLSSGDFGLVSDRLSSLHQSVSNMLAAGLAYALGFGDSSAVFDPSQIAADAPTALATVAASITLP